jgi:2-methylfumaryl-CoA hydratase
VCWRPKTRRANWREVRVVSFQLIGVKNISAANALARYGEDLFIKENDKKEIGKEKIEQKIFEIERRLLIRKRG